MKRIVLPLVTTLLLAAGGCANKPANVIELVPLDPAANVPGRLQWHVADAAYTCNSRGQYQLLAVAIGPSPLASPAAMAGQPSAPPTTQPAAAERAATTRPDAAERAATTGPDAAALATQPDHPAVVEQTLYVRMLWDISPTRTGVDPTAINARIGYLVQTSLGGADPTTLYYEGTGNVYADRPMWMGGRARFEIRQAVLRLSRGDGAGPLVDPFGPLRVEGTIVAGAAADAEMFDRFEASIERLAQPADPPSP